MLPPWFEQGELFGITLNRQVQCRPHKDKKSVGATAILFLGNFEGGALVLADGRQFGDHRVWHGYGGAQIEHWNEPITRGLKYAVVAHNTKTKPEAFPYRKRHVKAETQAIEVRPIEEERNLLSGDIQGGSKC